MKLKSKSLFAISIAVATMLIVFACTPPATDDTNGGNGADTTAPTVAITSPSGTVTINSNSYEIAGTASDAVGVDGVYFAIGANTAVKLSGTSSWSEIVSNFADGSNTFSVYSKDTADNQSATASVVIIYDTNAPNITCTPTGNITTNAPFTVTLSIPDGTGYWSTNGSTDVEFTSAADASILIGYNTTNISYYAVDVVNNTNSTVTYTYTFEAVFVSTTGDNANDGKTPANAVLSIQDAISLATNRGYTNIYVVAGIYVQGAGLSNSVVGNNYAGVNIDNANNINLIGGWDSGFTTHTGYSELDGANGATSNKHVIFAQDTSNLTIDGFVIRNGNSDADGGGVYFANTSYSLITNCIISNNIATDDGGGVFIENGLYNTISGTVLYNTAGDAKYGGGVCIYNSSNNTISGPVLCNTVGDNGQGGGVAIYRGVSNIISGTIFDNATDNTGYGGGVCIYDSSYNVISGSVSNNIVNGGQGGGVYIGNGSSLNNIVSGLVSFNSAGHAGGIMLYDASYSTISGTVSSNYASFTMGGVGGGVLIYGSYNTISGHIISNVIASGQGGGVYIMNATSLSNTFTATSVVRWNTATGGSVGDGGGVYNDGGAGSQITNVGFVISDNSPDDWADAP